MLNKTTTLASAIFASAIAANAGTPAITNKPATAEALLTGSFGVNVASGFIRNGIRQDSNPVVQSRLEVTIPTSVSFADTSTALKLSTLQNLHTEQPNATWWRSQVNIGAELVRERVTVTPSFELINSPNGKFDVERGFSLNVEYNDVDQTKFALYPHVRGYWSNVGNYFELGVAPLLKANTTIITLPVNVGLGGNNYYGSNERFGYVSAGVATSTPVYKSLNLVTGVNYYRNSDGVNNGDNSVWITSVGFGYSF
jgi:hypothetical protein